MAWIVEGARIFIENGYKLQKCSAVDNAIEKYKEDNDWLGAFLSECCIIGDIEKCAGGTLYKVYRMWAIETGEYVRRNRDFAEALRVAGFGCRKTMNGTEWSGLSISPGRAYRSTPEEDFLN